MTKEKIYDYVIIGSGFGGSVSALRLAEKGYKVLVLEKGKWFKSPKDFPKTNWQVNKFFWLPWLGLKGILKLSFFRHAAILSGVGVGGGSLVYANTLPIPKTMFFKSGKWKDLVDWENELKPYYILAKKMLGVATMPHKAKSDEVMFQLAKEISLEHSFAPTDVAVYFGEKGKTVKDPYFDGKGPDRTGCTFCAGCMLGCRYNAKNTLDKNYLYLAQQLGVEILSEKKAYDVRPINPDGSHGYMVYFKDSTKLFFQRSKIKTKGVIFAGGVLGTMALLLKLKRESLPNISPTLGEGIRTNSESLIGVTSLDKKTSFSEGIAIGSIITLDESRHVEPVQYSQGAGFWRILMAPMVSGGSGLSRLLKIVKDIIMNPLKNIKVYLIDDWSKRTHILLYMESIESTLRMKKNIFGGLTTTLSSGKSPTAFNPKARELAKKVEGIINGKSMVMFSESLLGIPTTAHILGGACMGKDADEGVIDSKNRVFNYENLYICDGSMISANIGVNPSLTITAITERAMAFIEEKQKNE